MPRPISPHRRRRPRAPSALRDALRDEDHLDEGGAPDPLALLLRRVDRDSAETQAASLARAQRRRSTVADAGILFSEGNRDRTLSRDTMELRQMRHAAAEARRVKAEQDRAVQLHELQMRRKAKAAVQSRAESLTIDGVSTTVPRRKSVSERFEMIQQKVSSMAAMRTGGLRRRASIRLEEKPLTLEQRIGVLGKIASLDVLSAENKRAFAKALEPVVFARGEAIMEEGDDGDRFYIVETGRVVVTRADPYNKGEEMELARLGVHEYFGEIALLVDAPRTATVRAVTTTTCLTQSKATFQQLMQDAGADHSDVVDKERARELMQAVLSNVSLFQPLSKLEQRRLIGVMGRAKYKDGDYVVHQGDVGNSMFIITKGEVKVEVEIPKPTMDSDDDDAGAVAVAPSSPGSGGGGAGGGGKGGQKNQNKKRWVKEVFRYHRFGYFGELALVNPDGKRTADCVAVGDVECLYLHRVHFNSCPQLAQAIGLKSMFSGFGSRPNAGSDSSDVMAGRRRQQFVDRELDNDGGSDAGSPRSRRSSRRGSPRGSPRSGSEEDDDDGDDLDASLNFDGKKRRRSSSGILMSGGGLRALLKSKVKGMIRKKREGNFMAAVHEAIAKKKMLSFTLASQLFNRVHTEPELIDERFPGLANKVDWLDRGHGPGDLMKVVQKILTVAALDRTEEEIGLLYSLIESLGVWETLCPSAEKRDMMHLCRYMQYERHEPPTKPKKQAEAAKRDNESGLVAMSRKSSGGGRWGGFRSDVIYKQNESGTKLYIVLEGSVKLKRSESVRGRMRHKIVPGMRAGKTFGELALMGMTTRRETVTVEAQGAAVITVELEAYSKCITKSTTTMTVEAKFSLLRECSLFAAMDAYKLFRLSLFFEPREVAEGAILVREGATSDKLVVMQDGMVDLVVERKNNNSGSQKKSTRGTRGRKGGTQGDAGMRKRKNGGTGAGSTGGRQDDRGGKGPSGKTQKRAKNQKKRDNGQTNSSRGVDRGRACGGIDRNFDAAPSAVSISKFLQQNLVVSTIGQFSSIGETAFLNHLRNSSRYRKSNTRAETEPVTAVARTRCKLLVLPAQHFRRLPKKTVEPAIRAAYRLKTSFHQDTALKLVVHENKRTQRKRREDHKRYLAKATKLQQAALLESMQRVASDAMGDTTARPRTSSKSSPEGGKDAGKVVSAVAGAISKMSLPRRIRARSRKRDVRYNSGGSGDDDDSDHEDDDWYVGTDGRWVRQERSRPLMSPADALKVLRAKPAQCRTNVFINRLRAPLHMDERALAKLEQTSTVKLESFGPRVRQRVRDSGLMAQDKVGDLVGSMSAHQTFESSSLMQDVFQDDSLAMFSRSAMLDKRRRRLLRHRMESSSMPDMMAGLREHGLPHLMKTPEANARILDAHLRKHTLNHVPGRHAPPPKKMPSWLAKKPEPWSMPRRNENQEKEGIPDLGVPSPVAPDSPGRDAAPEDVQRRRRYSSDGSGVRLSPLRFL